MNRTFVLLLIATVLLAFMFSADAANTKTKTKTKTMTKKTKSKTATKKSKTMSVKKTVTKSKTKAATAPVAAPVAAPSAAPMAAPSSAPAVVGTNDYTIALKLDASATAANSAKETIQNQLKTDLSAKSVTLTSFASGKFAVQDVAATATVTDAVVTAAAAKTKLTGTGYKLGTFSVKGADTAALTPSPSAARPLASVGLWAVLASVLLVAVTMF